MAAPSIGFFGAGAMSSAIVGGVGKTKLFSRYLFTDPNANAIANCCSLVPAPRPSAGADLATLCAEADVIVLGVKPQVAPKLLPRMRKAMAASGTADSKIIVSIMAGITIESLQLGLGPNSKVVRVMPNAPLKVGAGATGIAPAANVSQDDANLVKKLFECVGYAAVVPENQLDAVTGVSGSGPAYIAVAIEALADGGVKAGLPRPLALNLAIHTVYGTGAMCKEGGPGGKKLHPSLLKDLVCSPGGTSIYGLSAAEKHGLRTSLVEAVTATAARAKELGQPAAPTPKL